MHPHTFPLIASSRLFSNLHTNVLWEDRRNKKLNVCIIIKQKRTNDTSPRAENNNSLRLVHMHIYGHQKESCRSNKNGHPVSFPLFASLIEKREVEYFFFLFFFFYVSSLFFFFSLIMKKCKKRKKK